MSQSTEGNRSSNSNDINQAEDAKFALVARLTSSLSKLRYLYDMYVQRAPCPFIHSKQGREFWYMEMVRLTPQEVELVNADFVNSLGEDFYELAVRLGSSLEGDEFTVELYKFNETLTRLLNHTSPSAGNTPYQPHFTFPNTSKDASLNESVGDGNNDDGLALSNKTDSNLLLSTLMKLLIVKLTRLSELLSFPTKAISPIESKLIEDVLVKNVSNRVLRPYHNLLSIRAHDHIANIY